MDQVENVGYESHNAVQNLGSLALFLNIYIINLIIYCTLYLLTLCFKKNRWLALKRDKMRKGLFWNNLLAIFIDGIFEFLISSYL